MAKYETVDLGIHSISVEQKNSIVEYIKNNDPNLDEIDNYLDEMVVRTKNLQEFRGPFPNTGLNWMKM